MQVDKPLRSNSIATDSRWPFRLSLILTVATFFLISLGGLVTTQDAGMAVPDWPGTYGYNLFAYPIATWFYGPMDLFVEHGHRLLGSLVGMLAIGLCVVLAKCDPRPWIFWSSVILLLAIISQGIIGGVRVVRDARGVALIHGCVGPMIFAMAASLTVMTSRWWFEAPSEFSRSRWLSRFLVIQLLLVFLQLTIGASLRHADVGTLPSAFTGLVHLHLTVAALVFILVTFNAIDLSFFHARKSPFTRRWAKVLAALVVSQLCLGIGTWIVNYAWPWNEPIPGLTGYTISLKGYWESWITTAHQAMGSLIIAISSIIVVGHYGKTTRQVSLQ
jgi:heme a synthase